LDTSEVVVKGRAGRPNYPVEFKRRLAVESCEPEISVAKPALRNGLNTNMLFKWRREYRAGKLGI
jgi:transposase